MSFSTLDRTNKGVSGLPDTPNLSAEAMQAKFDELGITAIDGFNSHVAEIEAITAAASLGAAKPAGVPSTTSETVQAILNAIEAENILNTSSRHTHANKETLDAVTSAVKAGYDRVVSMLTNASIFSDTVSDDSKIIPSGKAIVAYMYAIGGGDANTFGGHTIDYFSTAESAFKHYTSIENSTTTFASNGTITTINDEATIVTSKSYDQSGRKVMTSVVTPKTGTTIYTETTTFYPATSTEDKKIVSTYSTN